MDDFKRVVLRVLRCIDTKLSRMLRCRFKPVQRQFYVMACSLQFRLGLARH